MAKSNGASEKRGIPLITIAVVVLLLIALGFAAPLIIGQTSYNSGNYGTAVTFLKMYPFTQDKYLDCVEKLGEENFANGNYDTALEWYGQLGEAGIVPSAKVYCAMAAQKLDQGKPVSQFLEVLDNITETPETVQLRDQTLLDAANRFFAQGDLEQTSELLHQVAEADVTSLREQINAIYLREALDCLVEVDDEGDYALEEPKAFALLRSAQEALSKCEDSTLATHFDSAMQKLLDRNIDEFTAQLQKLAAQAGEHPLAGETAWSLWNCFGHLVSSDNYQFLKNKLPYRVIGTVLEMGNLAATVSDPAQTFSGSLVDALSDLAQDGEVRRWNQGLCKYEYSLELTIDDFGKKAGEQPKLLFIRNYLPAGSAPQEYCMDFGIDLNMMALLPLEYWPSSMDDVTHIISLHYFHDEVCKYIDKSSIYGMAGIGGKPGIQETASVRIYSVPDGTVIYQSESITGPGLPESVTSDQIIGGYYTSGAIDLSELLVKALAEVFPQLK